MRCKLLRTCYCNLLAILLSVMVVSCITTSNTGTPPAISSDPVTVTVGAVLPLTGDLSQSGNDEKTALKMAVEDVNVYLQSLGSGLTIELVVGDSGTDPDKALEAIQRLTDDEGVQVVIGPDSSDAVFRALPWANWFNVVLVSPSSTAPTLALKGDNLFRMTPDDSHQAQAIAHKMWQDGKRIIIPVYRDNQYATDLVTAVRVNITMLGGTMLRGTRYGEEAVDFKKIATRLKKEVQKASLQYGTSALAIYVVGFEEAAVLCRAARKSSALSAVQWYGNESLTLNHDMVEDKVVSDFVIARHFTSPQYYAASRDDGKTAARIEEAVGHPVETYTLAAYDAMWLVGKTYLKAGVDADVTSFKSALSDVAESYVGATGPTRFNEAGDRERGDYHFWQVQDVDGKPKWVNIGSYSEE